MNEDDCPDLEEVWRRKCEPGSYTLAIRDLAILPSVSPRDIKINRNSPAPVDQKTVRKYAKEMLAGDTFPPILVGALRLDRTQATIRRRDDFEGVNLARASSARPDLPLLVLIDGMHRTMARQSVSNYIAAKVISLSSMDEARWLALSENCAHGLNLKAAEKRKKFRAYMRARKYIDPETGRVKSLRVMAAEVGRSHEDIRRKLKAEWPPIYEHLRKRDNEAAPAPELDVEDMARMRAEKVQRELTDGAVSFVRAALANGQRIEDPRARDRVAAVLEDAAMKLREEPRSGHLTIDNWDPEGEPLRTDELASFLSPKNPTETDA